MIRPVKSTLYKALVCTAAGAVLFCCKEISASTHPDCKQLSGCRQSICEKEYELAKARTYNDTYKIQGLENSLTHLRENCTASGRILSSEALKAKQKKIRKEYEEELAEAEREYLQDKNEAEREGKSAKAVHARQKYEDKIHTARLKYERKLNDLQQHP